MAHAPLFEIQNLHVSPTDGNISKREILRDVSLTVNAGESHLLMGPSGSGKSTLAAALLGSPEYQVTSGSIHLRGDDITSWGTDVRGKAGLFLAFQHPHEIPGVSVLSFLRQAISAKQGIETSVRELRQSLAEWTEKLDMDPAQTERCLDEGVPSEILQMAVLEPAMAILDDTSAELDADALQAMANGVHTVRSEQPALGTLAITEDQRLSRHLKPDHVHVLIDGQIVASGGIELCLRLETNGYESFT